MHAKRPGPRTTPPNWDVRKTMTELRRGLSQQPPFASVVAARAALAHLERMPDLETQAARVEGLVNEVNEVWATAQTYGIAVFQLAGDTAWTWTCGGRTGAAATPMAALIAALHAA